MKKDNWQFAPFLPYSGFRLIKREVVEKIRGQLKEKNYPSYMKLILLTQKVDFTIKEIPISYIPRKLGKSKMGKINTLLNYLFFLPEPFYCLNTQTKGTPSIIL